MQRVALGARVRFERQKKGWTQDALAQASGFTVAEIAAFESGQATPSDADMQRFAESLGIDAHELRRDDSVSSRTRRGVG